MIEAMQVLRRQIDLLGAETRISERKLQKLDKDSEEFRAQTLRRDILTGQLRELHEGLKLLERHGKQPAPDAHA